MNEEERAIKWLEKNTKNYKLKSEELHYILVLFNLINNKKNENQKYKEVINKAINKLGIYADKMTDNANAYAICVDLLDILKKVEHE